MDTWFSGRLFGIWAFLTILAVQTGADTVYFGKWMFGCFVGYLVTILD